eukprot:TRINITY_DN8011_c0_g2_i1.p1 TRINITY_DN8011_c0_g2~~TRINITY_DN8011_c0_g2_i1.p1  ORF type:complete len:164 (+),score=11.03 TRINITY_DN8011_c0_g2_i1:126-617(+)
MTMGLVRLLRQISLSPCNNSFFNCVRPVAHCASITKPCLRPRQSFASKTPAEVPRGLHSSIAPFRIRGRNFCTDLKEFDYSKEVDEINAKFAEAREEIEMAMESKETVYFDEEADSAKAAVKETLDMFDSLLAKLSESEKSALQRSMGLKMEQLKAELAQLDE